MKKCKKLLSVLLAALLLVGAVPAYAANGSGGLNGDHGDAIWQYCCDHPTPIDGTVEEQRADAVTGILRAWNYGIFRGDASGNFNAADTLTRAQLCQVLYNMGWTQAGDFK